MQHLQQFVLLVVLVEQFVELVGLELWWWNMVKVQTTKHKFVVTMLVIHH